MNFQRTKIGDLKSTIALMNTSCKFYARTCGGQYEKQVTIRCRCLTLPIVLYSCNQPPFQLCPHNGVNLPTPPISGILPSSWIRCLPFALYFLYFPALGISVNGFFFSWQELEQGKGQYGGRRQGVYDWRWLEKSSWIPQTRQGSCAFEASIRSGETGCWRKSSLSPVASKLETGPRLSLTSC